MDAHEQFMYVKYTVIFDAYCTFKTVYAVGTAFQKAMVLNTMLTFIAAKKDRKVRFV